MVAGDVLDAGSLRPALLGIDTAYYLVHSMGSGESFDEQDRRAAANFADAASDAGARRIVYLGGLGAESDLSTHLASRQEVGQILAGSGDCSRAAWACAAAGETRRSRRPARPSTSGGSRRTSRTVCSGWRPR